MYLDFAEDPARGFLPTGGTVLRLHEPTGEDVRVDSSLLEGTVTGSTYDPMLNKVIAWGPNRATALAKLAAWTGVTPDPSQLRTLRARRQAPPTVRVPALPRALRLARARLAAER